LAEKEIERQRFDAEAEAEAEEKELERKRLEAEEEQNKRLAAAEEHAELLEAEEKKRKGEEAAQMAKQKEEAARKAEEEQAAKDALDAVKAKEEAARKAKEEEAKEEAAQMANQSPVRNLWGAFKTAVFGKEIETSPPALPALQKVQEEAQQDENGTQRPNTEAQQDENEKQRTKAAEIMIESSDEDSIDDGYDEEEWNNVALPPGWLKFQCKRTASDFYTYQRSINAPMYKTWYHPSSPFFKNVRKRKIPNEAVDTADLEKEQLEAK
jgi:hypothetical protein